MAASLNRWHVWLRGQLASLKKLVGTALGGLTAGVVIAAAKVLFDIDLDPKLASMIVGIASAVGTYLAPANDYTAKMRGAHSRG